jgi:hypothetical protein
MDSGFEKVVAESIHQYLNQALGRELPFWGALYLAITALVAAGAAFFGSYLRKRAEQAAMSADFGNALQQMSRQTTAVETIKTSLASQLETLKSINERDTAFVTYQREQITTHLNAMFVSASEVIAICDLVSRRTWTESEDHKETQQKLLLHLGAMRLHVVILREFRAIDTAFSDELIQKLDTVRERWDYAFGELSKKDPMFKILAPDSEPYSGMKYVELAQKLYLAAIYLVDKVGSIPSKMQIPK